MVNLDSFEQVSDAAVGMCPATEEDQNIKPVKSDGNWICPVCERVLGTEENQAMLETFRFHTV